MKTEFQIHDKLRELGQMHSFLEDRIASVGLEASLGDMLRDYKDHAKYRSNVVFLNQERKVAEGCIRVLEWVLNDKEFFGSTPAKLP
jgi:hypothetical protein